MADSKSTSISPTWIKKHLGACDHFASWSKDRSTKVGAVIVSDNQSILSIGYNGFPRGVDDTVEARHQRPAKYFWTCHAEANAICNAARAGTCVEGTTMYLRWYPCADCCKLIVQSGITRLVCENPEEKPRGSGQWEESFKVTKEMLKESGVEVIYT